MLSQTNFISCCTPILQIPYLSILYKISCIEWSIIAGLSIDNKLFFAGEAWAKEYGTINGALHSGLMTAQAIKNIY